MLLSVELSQFCTLIARTWKVNHTAWMLRSHERVITEMDSLCQRLLNCTQVLALDFSQIFPKKNIGIRLLAQVKLRSAQLHDSID